MKFTKLPLDSAYLIEQKVIHDKRGMFSRLFCKQELESIGHKKEIVQVNHSVNLKAGALRGMHFQYPPSAEIKMVKCLRGSVFDVVIDLRRHSATFMKWHGEVLSGNNMKMMYIPEGFAHGFQALADNCELLYFHTEYYSPEHEGAVRYDDPMVGITWPRAITEISERDSRHPLLSEDFGGIL
ncbi:dTDP-4-dehydrorhamnose 3,5-epimerase [Thermodesulfobacteriota bacterium]